jgi:hypothetical protein
VDVALGLVDSIELLSPGDTGAGAELYYRLLGAGIRLAATSGTDAFLSISRGFNSDPPGWARTYVPRRGRLTVEGVADAIRRGETFVTNGPWIELAVDGAGPGSVLSRTPGEPIRAFAQAHGPGVRRLRIVSNAGLLAEARSSRSIARIEIECAVPRPVWIAAVADGVRHRDVLGGRAFAHTSPVYVELNGASVAEPDDLVWCLEACDMFEGARAPGRPCHQHAAAARRARRD